MDLATAVVDDEWAAEGGDVVDGDEDDTVIVGSADRRGREGGKRRGTTLIHF